MDPDYSILVVHRSAPDPVQSILEEVLADQPITVEEVSDPDRGDDEVLLVNGDTVVARSSLEALERSLLQINSDILRTGARGIDDLDLPSVLTHLDDVTFHVTGYPGSDSQKLPMILISRSIEARAIDSDGGQLRTSFQRLSRLCDERGTRRVYRRLDDAAVDVHLYGAPGWTAPPESSITVHPTHDDEVLAAWFVIYTADVDSVDDAALLALETGPNQYTGFWTYRASLVRELNDYVAEQFD